MPSLSDFSISDIDVFFVVADEHIPAIVSARQRFAHGVGEPFLFVEAPQNAPKDGAYLMAWYRGDFSPHGIDWYWQPQSHAVIPAETIILCDKDGLPRKDTPTQFDGYHPTPDITPLEAAQNAFAFSWAMLWITGKYAFRSPCESEMGLLRYSLNAYNEVCRFLGYDEIPITGDLLTAPTFDAKIQKLKTQVVVMQNLFPELKQRSFDFSPSIADQSHEYFEFLVSLMHS